jgi:hypothetical protein
MPPMSDEEDEELNLINLVLDLLPRTESEVVEVHEDPDASMGERIAAGAVLHLLEDPAILAKEVARSEADADSEDD